MFSTLTSAQVEYIVRDSGAKILCVSSERQLQKIKDWDTNVPTSLQHIVIFDELQDDSVHTFDQVCELGQQVENGDQVYQQTSEAVEPSDLASIIYTSGTTGDPKGAMLTHSNFMSNVGAATEVVTIGPDDVFLSFLPLSHVFERMGGHYLPLSSGATIAYAESPFTIRQNMQEVRPTIMMSVPRVYEAMHERILNSVKEGSPTKQKIFHWSVGVGSKVSQAIQQEKEALPWLIDEGEYCQ